MLQEHERKQIEERLLKDREQVLEAIGHFDDATDELRDRLSELSMYDNHPADVGSESHEQEQQFLLATMEGRRLYAIDEALGRLYKTPEEFGLCEVDREPIEFDRLMVIPETRVCARHAIMADEADGVDANPREADGNANEARSA
jgi:RNA polymerase-binding transcription factor DksA